MAGGKRKGRGHSGMGPLLPVIVVLMIAGAAVAAAKLVLYPPSAAGGRAVSAPASSAASSRLSSSAVSSKPSSSDTGSSVTGNYSDFASAVFIGDSLTSGIGEYSVVDNAGVYATNGMSTLSVLTKKVSVGSTNMLVTDALKQVKPERIYLLLGSNDMSWMSQATFISNYGKVIDAFKEAAPSATLYVQSIFPVTAAYEKSSGTTNEKINSYNTALSSLCGEKGVKYVDVGSALKAADGKLIPKAASDGYNIKKAYYKTWLDYLTTHE